MRMETACWPRIHRHADDFWRLAAGCRARSRAPERQHGDLLDEPFLALPPSAGPLRDFWPAVDDRGGHPVRIAAEINDTEETYEAVASGIGVCLLAPETPRSSTA